MVLAIDIGNTNIVIGCIQNKECLFVERLSTVHQKTEIEYAIDIKTVLDIYHIDVEQIEGGIISSVVPQVTNAAKLALEKILKKNVMVVGAGVKTGLNIRMDNPSSVGSDLIVGAVAGVAQYPVPLIIFDLGTANTVCVIDKNKDYIGGNSGVRGFSDCKCISVERDQSGSTETDHREKYGRLYEERRDLQ